MEEEEDEAATRVAALEAELQELCAAARAPAQRNWLRFAREALRKLGPPRRFAALRCALQDRQASLRQQRQILEKRLEENGLPPLGEGEEFLQELQAELQDLQLGGRQWRHRLQETATKLGDRGRRLSFAQQLCPAERELLRLQAELQHAQGTTQETQEAELQQLREEVAALEKAEEEAKAAASLPASAPGSSASAAAAASAPSVPSDSTPSTARSAVAAVASLRGAPPPPPPKAKARGPPPPKAKAKAPAPGPVPKFGALPPRSNGLVNINWKKLSALTDADYELHSDTFLSAIAPASMPELPPLRPGSAFEGTDVECMDDAQVQYWFRARPHPSQRPLRSTPSSSSSVRSVSTEGQTTSSVSSTGPGRTPAVPGLPKQKLLILDERTTRSAGLFLARQRIQTRSSQGQSMTPEDICKSILQCTVSQDEDGLQSLLDAVESNFEAGNPVASFVEAEGVDALSRCEAEQEHRLMHQVCGIAGVSQRLRCLQIESSWDRDAAKCQKHLEVLQSGLEALSTRKEAVQSFFRQVMKIGNQLNEAAGGVRASHGFRLQSLDSTLQTRSPLRPQLSLLHLALAQMPLRQVNSLCEGLRATDALRAQGLLGKSAGVQERCRELIAQRAALRELGVQVPSALSEDDVFQEHLKEFLDSRRDKASRLAELCLEVFRSYWELAVFLGDPDAVFPPPSKDSDESQDIFLFFHGFIEVLERARVEIARMRLREEIEASHEGGQEAAARVVEKAALESGLPASMVRRTLPLPERETKADSVLMTPPTSPSRGVRHVASPCRALKGVSPKTASARAVHRLKKLSCSPEADAQSDVSDWEPSPNEKPKPEPEPSQGVCVVPRRRRVLPERPLPSTPSSSSRASHASPSASSRVSSPRVDASPAQRSPSSEGYSGRPNGAGAWADPFGPEPSATGELITTPRDSDDAARRRTFPTGGPRGPSEGRRSDVRLRLSLVADRLENAALSYWSDGRRSDAGAPGGPAVSDKDDSPTFVSCSSSPSRRSCDMSTPTSLDTWESARSRLSNASPQGPEASPCQGPSASALAKELKQELRRRSNPREPRTPRRCSRRRPKIELSPVAEPGETPYLERGQGGLSGGRSRSDAVASSSSATKGAGGRPGLAVQPSPRRLWFFGARAEKSAKN